MFTLQKVKQGTAIVCPFAEYPANKDKWLAEHPKAEILEEHNNVFMQATAPPDAELMKKFNLPAQNTMVLMMIWAIVFMDVKSVNLKG